MDGPRTIFGEEFSRDAGLGVYASGNCEATETEAKENGEDLTDSHGMWNNDYLGRHFGTQNDLCLPSDQSIGLSRAAFVGMAEEVDWIQNAQMAPS